MKLWNYQRGEILDSIDCTAYIDTSSDAAAAAAVDCNTDVTSGSQHSFKDIRCMACSRRLLAISFNG